MLINKKIVNGFVAIFSSTLLISALGYFIRIILARNLQVSEYGLIYSVVALFGTFGVFVDLGLGSSLVKHISEFNVKKEFGKIKNIIGYSIGFQLLASIAVSLILGIAINLFDISHFSDQTTKNLVYLYAIYFMLGPIFSVFKSCFVGFHFPIVYSIMDTLQYGFVLISCFLLLTLKFGIYSLFLSYLCFAIIGITISYLILTKKIFPEHNKSRFKFDKPLFIKVISFGAFILMYNMFNSLFGKIDVLLLTFFTTLEDVGTYNVILPTILAIANLSSSLILVLLPVASELWAKKKKTELRENINKIYLFLFLIVLPLITFIVFNSYNIINLMFGERYTSGDLAFKILAFAILFIILTRINTSLLAGIDKPKQIGIIMFTSFLLNLTLSIILIPYLGIIGASISGLLAYMFAMVASYVLLTKHIKIDLSKEIFVIVILNLALFGSFFAVSSSGIGMLMTLGIESALIGIYLLACIMLKILNVEEILFYLKRLVQK